MPYASTEDLVAAAGDADTFRQLVEGRPPPETWSGDPVEYWITEAQKRGDALLNTYLPVRYRTPINKEASDMLVQIAADEGVFFLARTKGMATPEEYTEAERRQKRVEDLRDGKGWPGDPLPPRTRGRQSAYVESGRRVTRKKLDGFV